MSAHRVLNDIYKAGVYSPILDPGNGGTIYVERSPAEVPLVSAGAETRTLARPLQENAIVTIYCRTHGGDITLTVTGGFNTNGNTTVVFTAVKQFAIFQSFYDGTNYYWSELSNWGIGNTSPTAAVPVTNGVAGVGSSYKIARGVSAITGTGTVVTGLATVVAVTATMQEDASLTNGFGCTATIGDQAGTPAAGSVILSVWKSTANNDTTPTASGAAVHVNWIAVGT